MCLNRLTLIGFTGGDAETKSGNNGSTFTVFSVATKRSWKNGDDEWDSRTEWHRCLAFGKLGEFAAGLKKGAHVQGFVPGGRASFAAANTTRTA
jgi:single-strand DNA-binding protein